MRRYAFDLLHRFKGLESWARTAALAVSPKTTRIRRQFLNSSRESERHLDKDVRWVVLNLHTTHVDGQQGRRVYPLPVYFSRAGYRVAMVANRGFVGNIDRKLKGLLLSQPLTMIPTLESFTGSDALLVTQKARSTLPAGFRKQLVIKTTGALNPSKGELAFPFTLHPKHYHTQDDLKLDEYRRIRRRWRLFFSGPCGSSYYDTKWIRQDFEKVPRSSVVDIICRELAGDLTVDLESDADLLANLESEHPGFIVAKSTSEGNRVPSDRWLEVLAHASVFVAAPGVSYPMCHNIIEAMAVGTVPLTEYPEQFDPPLSHGENSLVYSGEDGLVSRVREIVGATPEWLAALSRGAEEYYDRHLSPQGFVGRIEADPRSTMVVHLKAHERQTRHDPADFALRAT